MPIRWRIVTAVLAVALLAAALAHETQSPLACLLAAAPADSRDVDARISGLPWARRDGAPPNRTDAPHLKLQGAAAKALASGDAHAAGVALLLLGDARQAIDRLRPIASKDASIWSDLAAAYLASGRASQFLESLAAADRALMLDPDLPEARFNRALALERLGLLAESRIAWQHCLDVDATSAWAAEVRWHLTDLNARRSAFDASRPDVAKYPQESRTWGEGPFLAEWAEGNADKLALARTIGDALVRRSGEMLLHDAVAAIDRAADERPLIEGHLLYRDGRVAYNRRELAKAADLLHRAAQAFKRGNSPMALAAEYFAANVIYDLNRPEDAYAELTRLLTITPEKYRALRAQILWQRALCSSTLLHWREATADGDGARAIFSSLGEQSNRAFVDLIVADMLQYSEESDLAWERRVAAFEQFSRDGAEDRLLAGVAAAMHDEVRRGNTAGARALAAAEIAMARRGPNRGLLAVSLFIRAMMLQRSGEGDPMRDLAEARAIAQESGDARRVLAEIDYAEGVVSRSRDARRAIELLTRSLDFFRESFPVYVPSALLARGRALRDAGRIADARADFIAGIEVLEKRRDVLRPAALETAALFEDEQQLFSEVVTMALAKGDPREALDYADRALQQSLRSRFPSAPQGSPSETDDAVLTIYVAGDDVVVFCARGTRVDAARVGKTSAIRGEARSLVEALASHKSENEIQRPARALHASLIEPLRQSLMGARSIVVGSDPRLGFIPFSVLFDGHYLIEDFELVMRPSNALPLHERVVLSPSASALVVANPNTSASLPGAEREAHDVAATYRDARVYDGDAATPAAVLRELDAHRVFHYAGHAAAPERAAGALLLSGGRLYASEIGRLDLRDVDLVVLAACRSTRAAHEAVPRDLATAFLVAGARNVVASGWDIDDATSAEMFPELHRAIASGTRVSTAVRNLQVSAIRAHRHPSVWAAITILSTERN